METTNFLEARDIVKRYAKHTALDGVSINVRRGRVFGLLGPNGAGKTTLIRIINRITMADSGSVTFDGHPLAADDIYNIGYLPEERGLYKKMKVGEQAIYLARLKGLDRRTAVERLRRWFDKFDINPWWDKKVEELSKGMQQKVQFVTTVLHEPQLLIFDEPFSGFDPVNTELLKREILALKEKGHTIVFSTHNMSSVEEICDDFALINHSRVVLDGTVADVRRQFRTGIYDLSTSSDHILTPFNGVEVLSSSKREHSTQYRLRKTDDSMTNSQLLTHIASQVEIESFQEQIPSMNEIFLKVVDNNTNVEPQNTANNE
ncbi:MAG: ABC transporter ATP-binding protein [Bacteroidales bacterium]|nr:ATP-binding cassette domain-containing protein [Muribaculaceae bacterium]MCI6856781.1 ABC transporter ATP-binding protein [Bacteroidales bacterium]MDY4943381.1 ABC transporter ATP-binding protein [Candidatus Limisoma sp.]MDD7603434.1 ABC transporter ATP-binding protein [Bacteroidales bacterium]MDD7760175.1 ABC transporter ATP-binding protein [Bacteroidales bacterium]